jgi:hypothetical protein
MNTLIGIIVCAVLFALYGLVREHGCTGSCHGCSTGSCARTERHAHND